MKSGCEDGVRSLSVRRGTSRAQYKAAVEEFDLLWETCASRAHPRRMRELLATIEAFESRRSTGHHSQPGLAGAASTRGLVHVRDGA